MNEDLIRAKLESLGRCLVRVKEKCPEDAGVLEGNFDLQDVLSVNLERSVQLCVDIASHVIAASDYPSPQTMGEGFDALAEMGVIERKLAESLRRAVGFRNLSVHAYDKLDWKVVYQAARAGIGDLSAFGRALEQWISE